MYVIQRKLGQSIDIGDNVKVKLLRIGDSTVDIGFEAPKEIIIKRTEDNEKNIENTQKNL